MIDNEEMMVGFIPVCYSQRELEEEEGTEDGKGRWTDLYRRWQCGCRTTYRFMKIQREKWLRKVIHEERKVVLEPP